ncbi:MAG: VCBS repeat-containing protein, partial [bacterium]|nr:VCBS repeat-containing protein [bacterium]
LNDGSGSFSDSGQTLAAVSNISYSTNLADLDGDGDLDIHISNFTSTGDTVYFNNGAGVFTDSGQLLGGEYTIASDIGDMDGDGDMDIVSAAYNGTSRIQLNDGNGVFTDSGVNPGPSGKLNADVSLADIDGDGDLDILLLRDSARGHPSLVLKNDGNGNFTDTGQLIIHGTTNVAYSYNHIVSDIDNDGDVDWIISDYAEADKVYLNDGTGVFTDSGMRLGGENVNSQELALGDVDGDGLEDVVVARYHYAPYSDGGGFYIKHDFAPVTAFPTLTLNELDSWVALVDTVEVRDVDQDFEGGDLTINFGITNADDQLRVENQGTGSGQIGISGSNITYEGTLIGTLDGTLDGINGNGLKINLNANADSISVTALFKTIQFKNDSFTPTASNDLTFTVTDSLGNASNVPTLTINFNLINQDPTNNGSLPADVSVVEDIASAVDLSAIDLDDADAGSGNLTITLTTNTGGNLSAVAGIGITIGGTPTARTLTGTLTDLNSYLNTASNITYLHGTANTNGDNADTIQVNVNDNGNTGAGGGTNIDLGTANVDIGAVNDAPVNTVPGTQTIAEETTTAITGISIAD